MPLFVSGSGPGAFTLVAPSGDTSGATDVAHINAALATSSSVWLHGNYSINAPISPPSNITLVLCDATITLANGSNCTMLLNQDYLGTSGGNSYIRILGIGRAIFDQNQANQTYSTASAAPAQSWRGHCILLSHVNCFEIRNLQFQNTAYFAISPQQVSNGVISDIAQYSATSGLYNALVQTMGGVQNLVIERITGVTEDDCVALSTGDTYTAFYADQSLIGASAGNVTDVIIRDVDASHITPQTAVHVVAIFTGAGCLMQRIVIENCRERWPSQAHGQILIGEVAYTSSAQPAPTDLSDITLTNVGASVQFHSSCSNVRINGLYIPAAAFAASPVQMTGSIPGTTISDITINDLFYNGPWVNAALIDATAGSGNTLTVNRLKVTGIKTNAKATSIFNNNGATVSGLTIDAVDEQTAAATVLTPGCSPVSGLVTSNIANPTLAAANVYGADQAVSTPGGGFVVPTPDGTKAYRLRVDNTGALALDRVPYFARKVMGFSPAVYYRLNETSGTTAAEQVIANNGTYKNGPTLSSPTLLGANGDDVATSVAFASASSQYMIANDRPVLDVANAISIIAIVKPTTVNVFQTILSKGPTSTAGDYSLSIDASGHLNFTITFNNAPVFWADTVTLAAGSTYLVALTWDASAIKFYVAGALGYSTPPNATYALAASAASNLYIGRRPNGTYFNGSVQEVALFNYVLSASQLSQLHSIAGV